MNAINHALAPVMFTVDVWLRVRDMLLPAIDILGGTHTETDVVAMLLAGKLNLWVSDTAAVITEIRHYPRLREISTFAAGGDMNGVLKLKLAIEQYGRDNGCRRSRIEGRKGWERVHTDYGFLSISLVKEL